MEEREEKQLLAQVQHLQSQMHQMILKVENHEKEITQLQHGHNTFAKLVKHDLSEIARILNNKKDKIFGRDS